MEFTLCFRSFYRQFVKNGKRVPKDYYDALREKDATFEDINEYPEIVEMIPKGRRQNNLTKN